MTNTELEGKLQENIEILLHWINEETNSHIKSMLTNVVELAKNVRIILLSSGCTSVADEYLATLQATQKLVDIYNR